MNRSSDEYLRELKLEYQNRCNQSLQMELSRLEGMIDFRLEKFPSIRSKTNSEDVEQLIKVQKEALGYLRKVHSITWDILIDRTIK